MYLKHIDHSKKGLATLLSGTHRRIRRDCLVTLSTIVLLAVGACQTTPLRAPSNDKAAAASREDALQHMGFKRTEEGWLYNIGGKILFDTASDALDAESQAVTERLGKGLHALGIDHLRVEGHTDNVGTAQFNMNLSLRRANAVAAALSAYGLPLSAMSVRGMGKERPVVENDTSEGRMQNRRVAVIVSVQ